MFNHLFFFKIPLLIWTLTMFIPLANASFSSAQTLHTINGSRPNIIKNEAYQNVLTTLWEHFELSIAVDKQFSYTPTKQKNTNGDIVFLIPLGTPLNNITYNNMEPAFSYVPENIQKNIIFDADGDDIASNNGIHITNVNMMWLNQFDRPLTPNDILASSKMLCNGKSSDLEYYKLIVSADIQAKTEYGLPQYSLPERIQKTFMIQSNDGICFIKPRNMGVNDKSDWIGISSIQNRSHRLYNSAVFQPVKNKRTAITDKGGFFSWSNGAKFPTTAFPEAEFSLLMAQNHTNYIFSIEKNPNNALTHNDNIYHFNGRKPSQIESYILKVENKLTDNVFYYSFTLAPTGSWFTFYPDKIGTVTNKRTETYTKRFNEASAFCASRDKRLPKLREVTNSIYVNADVDSYIDFRNDNGFKRTIGEGLMAEWGFLHTRNLIPESAYKLNLPLAWFYWTDHITPNGRRLGVGNVEGNVTTIIANYYYLMCVE